MAQRGIPHNKTWQLKKTPTSGSHILSQAFKQRKGVMAFISLYSANQHLHRMEDVWICKAGDRRDDCRRYKVALAPPCRALACVSSAPASLASGST